MSEMKEMVYQKDRQIEVLYNGEYKGYKFAILNLGFHPTAYVENKNGFPDYDTANELYGYYPHGGYTYFGAAYWDKNDKTEYLGWDYAHCDDFAGYYTPDMGYLYETTKQWTTTEIYEEVKKTIDYLSTLSPYKDPKPAETQLKELLSALYQRTGEQGFTLYRKDIVELAKDYGVKEEELNGKQ